MKGVKCLVLFGILAMTAVAHADYECSSYMDKSAKLSVYVNNITDLGDTVVVLESEDEKKTFFGTMFNEGGGLYKKQIVEFYGTNNTLTIVSQPHQCGRGTCDNFATQKILAQLKHDGSTQNFYCNEKKS